MVDVAVIAVLVPLVVLMVVVVVVGVMACSRQSVSFYVKLHVLNLPHYYVDDAKGLLG